MNLEQTLSLLGVVEPEKVKSSRAHARTTHTHTHTRKCVTKCRILSRVVSGRSRQVAHLHKKFDSGLSPVAHLLPLLLSEPLMALEKSPNTRESVSKRFRVAPLTGRSRLRSRKSSSAAGGGESPGRGSVPGGAADLGRYRAVLPTWVGAGSAGSPSRSWCPSHGSSCSQHRSPISCCRTGAGRGEEGLPNRGRKGCRTGPPSLSTGAGKYRNIHKEQH